MKLFMLQYVSYPSYMIRINFIGVFKTKEELQNYISKEVAFRNLPVLEHDLLKSSGQYHDRLDSFNKVHLRITKITVGQVYSLYNTN